MIALDSGISEGYPVRLPERYEEYNSVPVAKIKLYYILTKGDEQFIKDFKSKLPYEQRELFSNIFNSLDMIKDLNDIFKLSVKYGNETELSNIADMLENEYKLKDEEFNFAWKLGYLFKSFYEELRNNDEYVKSVYDKLTLDEKNFMDEFKSIINQLEKFNGSYSASFVHDVYEKLSKNLEIFKSIAKKYEEAKETKKLE